MRCFVWALLLTLRQQSEATRKLCAKVEIGWKVLKQTRELFWATRSLDAADCDTLSMLCSSGAVSIHTAHRRTRPTRSNSRPAAAQPAAAAASPRNSLNEQNRDTIVIAR